VAAFLIFMGIAIGVLRSRHLKDCERQARARSMSMLKDLPIIQYEIPTASEKRPDLEAVSMKLSNSTCPICTEDFAQSQLLRVLPCQHQYHVECIQDWLNRGSSCPIWYVWLILLWNTFY
jgi:Ring finger domain